MLARSGSATSEWAGARPRHKGSHLVCVQLLATTRGSDPSKSLDIFLMPLHTRPCAETSASAAGGLGFALTDAAHGCCLPPAQGHKRTVEGDTGPNTGLAWARHDPPANRDCSNISFLWSERGTSLCSKPLHSSDARRLMRHAASTTARPFYAEASRGLMQHALKFWPPQVIESMPAFRGRPRNL